MDGLTARLNGLCDAQPFETGWYLKDLATGSTAHRGGDVVVPSASTRKIAILMTALRAVEAGRLSLTQPVLIQAKHQTSNSGCFQFFLPDFTLPLRDVLVMMIIVSDNACTGTVVEMLGLDAINEFSRSVGMTGTAHRQPVPPNVDLGVEANRDIPPDLNRLNVTTPADAGRLLELIWLGTHDAAAAARLGCSQALCRLALDILGWQRLQQRLPSLLPVGTKVAHKTGTAARNFNDAGIVFEHDRPLFILTVYTGRVPWTLPDGTPGKAGASHHIGRLCRACWDVLSTEEGPAYTGS
ncbi:MAG TPA: serine hydrolase [bacterium]|nr:serine hydrolase [bacterium]